MFVPKTNWVSGEMLMHTDMNRVEAGVQEALDYAKIPGPPGPPGANGMDGRDGADGQDGRDGINGRDGLQGPPGTNLTIERSFNSSADMLAFHAATPFAPGTIILISSGPGNPENGELYTEHEGELILQGTLEGVQGPPGPAGRDGQNGRDGRDGVDGKIGRVRLRGIVNNESELATLVPTAQVGDAYWLGGRLYIFTDDPTLAVEPTFLRGNDLTGPAGPAGVAGPKGDTGATGPQGARGVQGLKGDTGATGPAYTPVLSAGTFAPTAQTGYNYEITSINRVGRISQAQFTITVSSNVTTSTRVIGVIPVGFRPLVQTRQNFTSDKSKLFYAAIGTNGNITIVNFPTLESGDVLHFAFSYINDSAS